MIDKAVGIDVCLEHYAVDRDGPEVEKPRWLKHQLKKLRRENRSLHRKVLGSNNRDKQRMIVTRTYEKVCDRRNDFQHKGAGYYVNN